METNEKESLQKKTLVKRKLGGLGLLLTSGTKVVSNIVQGGEAESAGVEVGDVIESINDESVKDMSNEDTVNILANIPVGKSVVIGFRSNPCLNGSDKKTSLDEKVESSDKNSTGNDGNDEKKETEKKCPAHSKANENVKAPTEKKFVKLLNWMNSKESVDTLHQNAEVIKCSQKRCIGSLMQPDRRPYGIMRKKEDVKEQAVKFLKEYYKSIKMEDSPAHEKRLQMALKEIEECGTYELDMKELIYGAKLAWRNAPRCIGRIQWNKLQVFDARDVTTARGMFDAICTHIKYGTNKGNIRSAITIFPQRREDCKDFRIWNAQFIKYAGYKQPDGTVIGDRMSVEFTQVCYALGWKGEGTQFDVLPLVLQASGQDPEVFDIPPDLVLQVDIKHPKYDWFEELNLKWYCLPAVANMLFDVGGVEFPCAPFNGWYMATEIGARNFGDTARYNLLQPVANKLGLDTRTHASLWKDRALVELNVAVLHSFNTATVTIMDHHSASESFMKHLDNEQRLRGGCPSDWVWIVPPISGSACPVFHQEMLMYTVKPSFDYQDDPWKYFKIGQKSTTTRKRFGFKEVAKAVKLSAKLMGEAMAKRQKAIILYATETGKSENYAKILGELFSHAFDPKVICMSDFNSPELEHEQLVLIVTSTFGNGEAPSNGEVFGETLYKMKHPPSNKGPGGRQKRLSSIHIPKLIRGKVVDDGNKPLANLRFSVFGLGSRAYPHFCAFAHSCRDLIDGLGGEEIFPLGEGDELCGQEESFMSWAKSVFKAACEQFCAGEEITLSNAVESLKDSATSWSSGKFRYVVDESSKEIELFEALTKVHNRKVHPLTVICKENLQHPDSSRSTILVRMKTGGNKELDYKPGDHLALFAENRSELVDALIGLLDDPPPPDQPLKLEVCKEISGPFGSTKHWDVIKRLPQPCTLRQAFTRYLDITSPATPQLLLQLATQTTDETEKKRLEELGTGSGSYEDWKFNNYPNMVELLQEFPSLKVNVMLLLTQLPLLQSRYYSISSSPLLYPDEVHVTVAVVSYRTQGGKGPMHYGVCSTWLDSLKPDDIVPGLVRIAHSFHMPEETSVPIIMVGPGTGIAPFRSFWQERFYQKTHNQNAVIKEDDSDEEDNNFGKMQLYFGCRNSAQDFIYKEELMNMKEGEILDDLYVALSREPNQEKCYVQHLLKKNSESVCDTILLYGGHIYVCGDVSMAADVSKMLQNMLENDAALSPMEAQDFISQLRSSGRYHEDIFGVTLRTAEVTDRVRTAAKKAWVYVSGGSAGGGSGPKPKAPLRKTNSTPGDSVMQGQLTKRRAPSVTVVMQPIEDERNSQQNGAE